MFRWLSRFKHVYKLLRPFEKVEMNLENKEIELGNSRGHKIDLEHVQNSFKETIFKRSNSHTQRQENFESFSIKKLHFDF